MFRQIDYPRFGRLGLSKLLQELIRQRLQEEKGRDPPHKYRGATPKRVTTIAEVT